MFLKSVTNTDLDPPSNVKKLTLSFKGFTCEERKRNRNINLKVCFYSPFLLDYVCLFYFLKKILWQVCFYSLFCSQLLPLLGIIYIKFRGEKLEKYSTYLIPIDMNFII